MRKLAKIEATFFRTVELTTCMSRPEVCLLRDGRTSVKQHTLWRVQLPRSHRVSSCMVALNTSSLAVTWGGRIGLGAPSKLVTLIPQRTPCASLSECNGAPISGPEAFSQGGTVWIITGNCVIFVAAWDGKQLGLIKRLRRKSLERRCHTGLETWVCRGPPRILGLCASSRKTWEGPKLPPVAAPPPWLCACRQHLTRNCKTWVWKRIL